MSSIPFRPLAAVVAALLLAAMAVGQCELQWQAGDAIPSPRGEVSGMTWWDPDGAGPSPSVLVVCGQFAAGTEPSCSVAAFDGGEWTSIGSAIGYARCIAVHGGQLVVATAGVLRRWDGTVWQPFGTTTGGPLTDQVEAMASFQGDLYVGGHFTHVDGLAASRLARWNGTTWSALGTGLSTGWVQALAVYSNRLYVGGSFSTAGGVPAANLAAWSGTAWSSVATINGPVWALAARNGTAAVNSYLFIGGNFTTVGALSIPGVARYTAATNAWTSFGPMPGICRSLFVRNTQLTYELVAADMSSQVWRWNGTGWVQLGAPVSGSLYLEQRPLQYHGGRYVVGWGTNATTGGISSYDGQAWQPLSGGIAGQTKAVVPFGVDLAIGGEFATIAGATVHGVAVGGPGAWQPLGNGVTGGIGAVHALVRLSNGDLVAAGSFSIATGGVADHIARWDGAAWQPLANGVNGTVHALAVMPNGDLIAGGEFTTAGSVAAARVARWNGGFWTALGAGVNGRVNALAASPSGELFVGGVFTQAGGSGAAHVARLVGSAWSPLAEGTDGEVLALAWEPGSGLLVGGAFVFAGNSARPGVARWNGAWTSLPGWPLTGIGQVCAVATLPDGSIVIAGSSITLPVAGQGATDHAFRIDGLTREPLDVGESGDQVTCAAVTAVGSLAIGGSFFEVGSLVSANFAVMAPVCPAIAAAFGSGCTGGGGPDVLSEVTLPWDGTMLRTRATGLPALSLALVVYGFSQISVPISLLLPEGLPGCSLYVSPDILGLALPNGGAVDSEVFIAPSPSLVGVTFFHQVLPLELDAGATIVAITASNGLALTVGSY